MQFVDQAIARRIEAALSRQSRGYCEAARDNVPEIGAQMVMLGPGAQATYYGPASVLSRVSGLGADSPATREQVEAAEEFYFSRGEACKIELFPLLDPELIALLRERGYGVKAFTNVFVRGGMLEGDDMSLAPGVTVRLATGAALELVLDAIQIGFGGSTTDAMRRNMGVGRHIPGIQQFGAYVGESQQPIGGGSMEVIGPTALLFGASTLPEHRGKGVQSSLIRERVRLASRGAGCDLLVIQSRPGLTSERNILRHGFRLAYTRPAVTREPPVR